jgi:hypothetical protein
MERGGNQGNRTRTRKNVRTTLRSISGVYATTIDDTDLIRNRCRDGFGDIGANVVVSFLCLRGTIIKYVDRMKIEEQQLPGPRTRPSQCQSPIQAHTRSQFCWMYQFSRGRLTGRTRQNGLPPLSFLDHLHYLTQLTLYDLRRLSSLSFLEGLPHAQNDQ